MLPPHLDLGVLRSFLLIAEGHSFAEAAEVVGRSPSAVSLQIQRLEDEIGAAVFVRGHRQVSLTPAGERLLGFARSLLRINDEAMLAFRGGGVCRPLRFGATQDFVEALLPEVLRRLSLEHPDVELTLCLDRSNKLVEDVRAGAVDVAVAVRRDDQPLYRGTLLETPMIWIGREGDHDRAGPVPLVLFDAPCSFREAALQALAAAGREHRLGLTSPSLAGLRSAVDAGLGVTVRTRYFLAPGLVDVAARLGLPPLPSVAFALYARAEDGPWPARDALANLCRRIFAE